MIKRCPLCSAPGLTPFLKLNSFVFGRSSQLVKCPECKCLITTPIPRISPDYYQNSSRPSISFKNSYKIYKDILRFLLKVIDSQGAKSLKVLDIGSGDGSLIYHLKLFLPHLEIYTVEPSNKYATSLCSITGNLNFSSLSDLYTFDSSLKFDVIIFSSVLEHLEDPSKTVKQSLQFLTSKGSVFISQVDYSALFPTLFPQLWYGWQPQEHYYHFSLSTFQYLLPSLGLELIEVEHTRLYQPLISNSRSLPRLLFQPIVFLLASLSSFLGRGDVVNIHAKKKYL